MTSAVPDPAPLLAATDLHHRWDDAPVLAGLSVAVRPGEVVAVVGANGSGKSTLLGGLAGRHALDRGAIERHGRPSDVTSRAHLRAVHALLGDTGWLPSLTVLDHLTLLAGRPGAAAEEAALAALAALGVDAVADRTPASLSSGQRQRVVLATAAVRPWEVLLLDEPERHLDREATARLGGWVRALVGEDRAALVATHDRGLEAAADRLVRL